MKEVESKVILECIKQIKFFFELNICWEEMSIYYVHNEKTKITNLDIPIKLICSSNRHTNSRFHDI